MKEKITVQNISELSGYSRNTISKVLNGKPVPEKTRDEVLKACKALNYKAMADLVSPHAKKTIMLLSGRPLSNINFFLPIVKGIENTCFNRGINLIQYTYNETTQSFSDLQNYIASSEISGIVAIECFFIPFIKRLLSLNIPSVFIDFAVLGDNEDIPQRFDIIEMENEESVSRLTNHLIRKGVTQMAFAGDITHCRSFLERYQGMVDTLYFHSLTHEKDNDLLLPDNFQYGNPQKVRDILLRKKNLPECFICSNDFVARGMANAVQLMGRRIPRDIFITGFDDSVESEVPQPKITTIGLDKEYMGSLAIKTVMERIDDPNRPSLTINVGSKVILKESTGD